MFTIGKNEEAFDSRFARTRASQQKRLIEALICGASEETLTLDLFLGKEAL